MSTIPNNPASSAASGPHKEPADAEEIYYEGSPLIRGLGAHQLLWPLAGLILIAAPFVLHHFGVGLPAVGWIVCIVVGLCLPMVPVIHARTIRYRISNYRIDYERGLVSKDIDTLELWHVEDLHLHQSLFQRLLGVGSIRITSHDPALPELLLRGVPHPRPLYEMLKQRVIAVKRARGVIKVDAG
jgi:hypothetical protein